MCILLVEKIHIARVVVPCKTRDWFVTAVLILRDAGWAVAGNGLSTDVHARRSEMDDHDTVPDPERITTPSDLAREIKKLQRLSAGKGQVRLSVREISKRTGIPSSTLGYYLQGARLYPRDAFEKVLLAMGVPIAALRPWLNAWEVLADTWPDEAARGEAGDRARQPVGYTEYYWYEVTGSDPQAVLGIVTGQLRRVMAADIWVNSENTDMEMSRFNDYSVSAIIRFGGATLDETGRVVDDRIAAELAERVEGRWPVPPGSAITTGSGQLADTNRVRHLVHVAAVQGEPGVGYTPVTDLGRCVRNALAAAERLVDPDTILFPLLGAGTAHAQPQRTVGAMLGAVVDHLDSRPVARLRRILFLAHTEAERTACRTAFDRSPRLRRARVV
jgi:O-acetyl-ADP-ribose deacetylase (regulator of RNase III)